MTKSQAFKHADPLLIAQMYATNASDVTLSPLRVFLKRKNKLPRPVLAMMVLYIIAVLGHKLPLKESYYRITQEDWVSRNILSTEAALSYYVEAMEIAKNIHPSSPGDKTKVLPGKPFNTVAIDPKVDRALDNLYNRIK